MSPSRTGPFTLRMMERLLSSKNSTRTCKYTAQVHLASCKTKSSKKQEKTPLKMHACYILEEREELPTIRRMDKKNIPSPYTFENWYTLSKSIWFIYPYTTASQNGTKTQTFSSSQLTWVHWPWEPVRPKTFVTCKTEKKLTVSFQDVHYSYKYNFYQPIK